MIANTLILTTDGLIYDKEVIAFLFLCNKTFIMIAGIDKVVRFIGLGPKVYFQDKLNAFDTIVVILSVIELFVLSGENSAISAFRSVRLFRIFRVFRFTKVFKTVKYMAVIIEIMGNLVVTFMYLFGLVILFVYIYSLLGMEIFGGKLNYERLSR